MNVEVGRRWLSWEKGKERMFEEREERETRELKEESRV